MIDTDTTAPGAATDALEMVDTDPSGPIAAGPSDDPVPVTELPVPAPGQISVAIEHRPGSQVALDILASAEDVDAAFAQAVRRLGGRSRLPGFRPGKAPGPIVERALGPIAVAQEATEQLVPAVYPRALREAGVVPVSDPELQVEDIPERGVPFRFRAVVTVQPTVDLGAYRDIRVEAPSTEITDERVEEAIEEVRRRHAEIIDVDRPAQSGDLLRATLVMRRGDQIVGGEAEERDVELDRERLLPGLADGLLGLAAGESHTLPLTLPQDYASEELRGQEVHVEATVHTVRERALPPLDDALAVLDGHGETLDELTSFWRDKLEKAQAAKDEEEFEAAVLEQLRDAASVEIPDVMIEHEIDRQLRDLEMRLAGTGLQLERYLEYTGETVEQVRAARRDQATLRVKLELVLAALAEAEGLDIDESDVEREEEAVIAGREVTRDQRSRIHAAAHRDLLLRGAAQRALSIARGEG